MDETVTPEKPKADPVVTIGTLAGRVKTLLKGKKSYLVIIAIIVLTTLEGKGIVVVPDYVWTIIKATLVATLSAKVNRLIEASKSQT